MTIRDIGLAIVKSAPWLEGFGRWCYIHLPDFLHDTPTSRLREHFAEESSVTFIQIGAYDGVAGDPLRRLVLGDDGWSGVMIEPQPDAFDRLQSNYAAQSQRLKFLNVAISHMAGERTLFYISEAEQKSLDLPDWASQLPSFNSEHLTKHFPQARLARHNVRTVTFEEVAKLLPASKVDVVVIDTEGHERAILDTIDINRHQVKAILYEHKHLSESDRSLVENKLKGHGFSLKTFSRDTIACRALPSTNQRSESEPSVANCAPKSFKISNVAGGSPHADLPAPSAP